MDAAALCVDARRMSARTITFLVPGQYQFYDTNNHSLSGQITVSS